jgi:glyoxylate/hydroxypyruvate/2-ketogluconate reductase
MKPQLLITRRIFEQSFALLQPHFEVIGNQADDLLSAEQVLARAPNAQALFCVSSDNVDQAFLNAMLNLKMIASGSVGTNHIDLQACRDRQIAVSNTPDVLTDATADMAWALLMATARRVTESEAWLRSGAWDRWAFEQFLGVPVSGATLGIVGMGRIGAAIAKRARGFDMDLLYHNRSESSAAQALGAGLVDKQTLLTRSDFVMLVLPYSAQSHHFIDQNALAVMKPSAILINIARGGIVDDAALARALADKKIAGAGLDVFENEPRLNPDLLALKNVVLTPHIGSATGVTRLAMSQLAAKNLLAWVDQKPLLTPVL